MPRSRTVAGSKEAEAGPKTEAQGRSLGEIVEARGWHCLRKVAQVVPGSLVRAVVAGEVARAQTLFSTWASGHGVPHRQTAGPSFGRC